MIKPMLARLGPEPFDSPDYIWEVKYDGIRCVAFSFNENYCLQARSGTNKTHLFPELELKTRKPAVLDGELVSISFNAILACPPKRSPVLVLDWKIRKGAIDGQEILHTGADYQQAARS